MMVIFEKELSFCLHLQALSISILVILNYLSAFLMHFCYYFFFVRY